MSFASRWAPAATALLIAALPPAVPVQAGDDARIARAFDSLKDSVVPVHFTLRLLETPEGGQGDKVEGVLCGVVAGPDGLVVTTADVFPDLDGDPRQIFVPVQFQVRSNRGERLEARAVGLERSLNLAFLQVRQAERLGRPPVRFARRPPRPGERVLFVGLLGEQLGYGPTFTEGRIVSTLRRPQPIWVFDGLVQDLTIGGVAATLRGEGLGIIGEDTLDRSPSGAADLASAGNVLSLFSSISQGQRPGYPVLFPYHGLLDALLERPPALPDDPWANRGWLGIIMQPLSPELADYWSVPASGGVVISAVMDGSPAEEAGLQVGDVILQVDHAPVRVQRQEDLTRFRDQVQSAGAGRELPLSVFRGGSLLTIPLTLGSRPKTVFLADEEEDKTFGLTVKELTFDFLQSANLPSRTTGVFVAEVENAGWADVGGLAVGDVITQVHGVAVDDLDSYRRAMATVHADRPREVVFFILRPPRTLFVAVRTDW